MSTPPKDQPQTKLIFTGCTFDDVRNIANTSQPIDLKMTYSSARNVDNILLNPIAPAAVPEKWYKKVSNYLLAQLPSFLLAWLKAKFPELFR